MIHTATYDALTLDLEIMPIFTVELYVAFLIYCDMVSRYELTGERTLH